MRLTSVDLPTLGRPTTASTGHGPGRLVVGHLGVGQVVVAVPDAGQGVPVVVSHGGPPPRRGPRPRSPRRTARTSRSPSPRRAAAMKSATVESRASRVTTWSRVASIALSSSVPCTSRARRARRACSDAVSSTRTSASGATTVVMSRPSTTMPPAAGDLALATDQLGPDVEVGGDRADELRRCGARGWPGRDVAAVDGHDGAGRGGRDLQGQLAGQPRPRQRCPRGRCPAPAPTR